MTKKELVVIATVLTLLAIVLHAIHVLIFRDLHHVAIYGFGDIAFLPIEILVVSLVVDQVLKERERQATLHKMKMVIGTFFSALGQPLLEQMCFVLEDDSEVRLCLAVDPAWTAERILEAEGKIPDLRIKVRPSREDMEALRELLTEHRDFLLGLLQNSSTKASPTCSGRSRTCRRSLQRAAISANSRRRTSTTSPPTSGGSTSTCSASGWSTWCTS